MTRIALVGAGFISHAHAEALRRVPALRITAVIDPVAATARALALEWDVPHVFASLQDALAEDVFDRAHVLVPPKLHAEIAGALIAAGKPLLVEKPLADSASAAAKLVAHAKAADVPLGVNQNFVHHPAFAELHQIVSARRLGRPNHVACVYNVPLRQMSARQFGHWMFASPGNLLLEQAVHPLSQIAALAGAIGEIRALAGAPLSIARGQTIYPSFDAVLAGAELPANLRFAVGQPYPLWQVSVVCDDGVVTADILANRCYTSARTRWMDTVDGLASSGRTASAMVGASVRNARDYGQSLLRLKPRSDGFFQSMATSIASFHAALDAGRPAPLDGAFGAKLVETCERIRDQIFPAPAVPAFAATPASAAPDERRPEIAILGGTGFIGTHLVRRCVADGLPVAIMARSMQGLPDIFHDPLVTLHRGDIRDPAAVKAAIEGVPVVVNLAHGGGGGSREEVRAAMVGGAEMVARACLAAGVRRLVHVGSIAALYLGPQAKPVTGETPPDPRSEQRADYAYAKAVCDRMLHEMHVRENLPLVILRPGVVVGEGTPAFHGGLGFFNNEQHCIGWNNGRNPLPFVLVEDVADAILRACRTAGLEGRSYNLVGDVRPSAREFVAAVAAAVQRPLKFHPLSPFGLLAGDFAKWAIKRAGGRRAPMPSLRDLRSRGMRATFDCADAKRDLGWTPVGDSAVFHTHAIAVHVS